MIWLTLSTAIALSTGTVVRAQSQTVVVPEQACFEPAGDAVHIQGFDAPEEAEITFTWLHETQPTTEFHEILRIADSGAPEDLAPNARYVGLWTRKDTPNRLHLVTQHSGAYNPACESTDDLVPGTTYNMRLSLGVSETVFYIDDVEVCTIAIPSGATRVTFSNAHVLTSSYYGIASGEVCDFKMTVAREHDWILQAENVCFSATNNRVSAIFRSNVAGTLLAVRLVHRSGAVMCGFSGPPQTNWGCVDAYPLDLAVYLTRGGLTAEGPQPAVLFPELAQTTSVGNTFYYYPPYTSDDPELIFDNGDEFAREVGYLEEFTLWYTEVYYNFTVEDNSGVTCADVYFSVPEPLPVSNALTVTGCRDNDNQETFCVAKDSFTTATASTRCCSMDGSSCVSQCDAASVDLMTAKATCASLGRRLCALSEYSTCCATGCAFSFEPVWTSDDCDTGSLTVTACRETDSHRATSCVARSSLATATAATRCCSMDGSSCQSVCSADSVTKATAEATCAGLGLRLCALSEMRACCGTGCAFSFTPVWALDTCREE